MSGKTSPSWLDEPCPAWCARSHHEDDHPEDRYHQSEPSIFPAVAGPADQVPITASLSPANLSIRAGRYVGEVSTWIAVESLDELQPRIVLAEPAAWHLWGHLEAQLRQLAH